LCNRWVKEEIKTEIRKHCVVISEDKNGTYQSVWHVTDSSEKFKALNAYIRKETPRHPC